MGWRSKTALAALFVAAMATGAAARERDIELPDGSHYRGESSDNQPNGAGVLVDAQGDRFSGTWKDGQLNGHGTVVWANGDRYDGEWSGGKAEGHGVQIWADGRKYDGAWHNDKPDGRGTVTRNDGTQFAALFVDGRRQPDTVATPTPAAPAARQGLAALGDQTLKAIDGSSLALTPKDQSFVRTITAADGTPQTATFNQLGNGMGSVTAGSGGAQIIGLFRMTPGGLDAQFADGHSEIVALNGEGGLFILSKTAAGDATCIVWYPQGHSFSAEDRKAAVAAYARQLGVRMGVAAASNSACAARETPAAAHAPGARGKPHLQTAALPVPPDVQAAANASTAGGLLNVPVRDSHVHPIDAAAPVSDSGVVPTAEDAVPRDERIASNCLKVDSDGAYWGFRNHCGYSVQFAYCLLRGADDMTACRVDGAGVMGSVSANGFGALFADTSLGARGSEHAFRWVGCRGGAGEVAAHLDQFEPAAGRCVRASLAQAQ